MNTNQQTTLATRSFLFLVLAMAFLSSTSNACAINGKGAYLNFINHSDNPIRVECTGREGLTANSRMCNRVDGTVPSRGNWPGERGPFYIQECKSDSTTNMIINLRSSGLNRDVKIKASGGSWHVVKGDSGTVKVSVESGDEDHILVDIGDNSKWMKKLKNTNIPINQLLLMGTHDSATAKYYQENSGTSIITDQKVARVVTQRKRIEEQLRFGIRFLDLRFGCLNDKCNKVGLVHGGTYLSLHMRPTLDGIVSFLRSNPSEFIIVSMKAEYGETAKIKEAVEAYIKENMRYFYSGANSYPSVREARGKMVIIDREIGLEVAHPLYLDMDDDTKISCYGYGPKGCYGPKGAPPDKTCLKKKFSCKHDGKSKLTKFKYQDRYDNPDYDEKRSAIKDFAINYMNKNNFNESYNLNFMSAAGGYSLKTPQDFATRMNSYLKRASFQTRHAGIFILDYPIYHAKAPRNKSRYYSIDVLIKRSLENSENYK